MKRAARTFEAHQARNATGRVIYVVRHHAPMILLEGNFPCMGCGMPVAKGAHRPKGVVDYGKFAVAWYNAKTHRRTSSAICAWRTAPLCVKATDEMRRRSTG